METANQKGIVLDITKQLKEDYNASKELLDIVARAVGETKHINGAMIRSARAELMNITSLTEFFNQDIGLARLTGISYIDSNHNAQLPSKIKIKQYFDDYTRIGLLGVKELPSRYIAEKVIEEMVFSKGYFYNENGEQIRATAEPYRGTEISETLDDAKILISEYISGNPIGQELKALEDTLAKVKNIDSSYNLVKNKRDELINGSLETLALFHVATAFNKYAIEDILKQKNFAFIELRPETYKIMFQNNLENILNYKGLFPTGHDKKHISISLDGLLDEMFKDSNMLPEWIIHGDMHLGNFIHGETGIKLIDFGHVKKGTPEQDLAMLLINNVIKTKIDQIKEYTGYYLKKREFLKKKIALDQTVEPIIYANVDSQSFFRNVLFASLFSLVKVAGNMAYSIMNKQENAQFLIKTDPYKIRNNMRRAHEVMKYMVSESSELGITPEARQYISDLDDLLISKLELAKNGEQSDNRQNITKAKKVFALRRKKLISQRI